MAWTVCGKEIINKFCNPTSCLTVWSRNGHHLRGKPPSIARSLEQRLQEINKVDEELTHRVDISLAPPAANQKQLQDRLNFLRENKKTRDISNRSLIPIDLEKSRQEWMTTVGPAHVKDIADHYDIFESLFDRAYFYPRVPLNVVFSSEGVGHPVYFGNVIKPKDAVTAPLVSYKSDDNTFWTLTLTNLDGHFTNADQEYVHWMVVNIPGCDMSKGETIFEYLQPFPPKGTGFHRYAFLLYKQDKKMDFSMLKHNSPSNDLNSRSFSTHEFYKTRQDYMTPGGLAFFQSDWDSSLHNFFHETLNMKEPIFEYDFDEAYIKKQKWFPKREPFNLYMDKYRDPKQINKEFLIRKLKKIHPFKPEPPPLPFPNAQYFNGYIPTWLKLEIRKSRLKWGRINEIEQ